MLASWDVGGGKHVTLVSMIRKDLFEKSDVYFKPSPQTCL